MRNRTKVKPFGLYATLFALVFTLLFFMPCSNAELGYDLHVDVSNNTTGESTSWSRSQSTHVMSFQFEGESTGDGTYFKYLNIPQFNGIRLKENTYTNPGRLVSKNTLKLQGKEGTVKIKETGDNRSELYTVEINQTLPAFVYTEDDLFYDGESIYSRNAYENLKNNEIHINYQATRLLKEILYADVYNSSYISAEVTPSSVKELVLDNITTAFHVSSDSDQYSEFRFISGDDITEQDYYGSFKMDTRIVNKREYCIPDNESKWLNCCGSGYDTNETWLKDESGLYNATGCAA